MSVSSQSNVCITCPISLEKTHDYYELSCGHKYSTENIAEWYLISQYCPLCRHPIDFGQSDYDIYCLTLSLTHWSFEDKLAFLFLLEKNRDLDDSVKKLIYSTVF